MSVCKNQSKFQNTAFKLFGHSNFGSIRFSFFYELIKETISFLSSILKALKNSRKTRQSSKFADFTYENFSCKCDFIGFLSQLRNSWVSIFLTIYKSLGFVQDSNGTSKLKNVFTFWVREKYFCKKTFKQTLCQTWINFQTENYPAKLSRCNITFINW